MKNLVLILMLSFQAQLMLSQESLVFSGDSVVATACDGFILIGVIDVYNTSDQDIRVRWNKKRLEFPQGGYEFMIAGGIQYLSFQMTHAFNLYGGDSTEVYFQVYPDTLLPGDSVIWQVLFYDENDSIGTATLLTAILECPQSTAVYEKIEPGNVELYPNPFNSTTTLLHDPYPVDQIRIFDLAGRLIETKQVTGNEITIDRNGLNAGLYILGLYHKGMYAGQAKMMVTD